MRADIQHEVSHDAKKLPFLPRFEHIRKWPPTSAGKSRCLPVIIYIYTINYILFIYYYIVNHPFFNQLLLITDINLPGWIIQLLSCFGGMLWIQNGWPGTS